ncbi:MAG: ribosomal protein S18-alanine N-acetyltransferase [Pyrinomonadaceae bacterium]
MQPSVANTESSLDPISISNMTEHDLLEVVEIEEQSRLSRWGWAAYYAELQGINRSLMLVARTNSKAEGLQRNRVAGYIVARFSAGELHINNVAVRGEYRGRGIGKALLARILAQGRKLNAAAAFLELRAGNSIAQSLYEKAGFVPVGKRRNYYSDPVEDAVTMAAQLKGSA